MDLVIETHELTKRYDGFTAVDALELEVRAGEIFGFLGPNGAGKSTTILMLLGLTEASGGSVRVLGYDPARQPIEVKRRVGYMPENLGFYGDLTGRENLEYVAELNDIPRDEARRRIDAALEKVRMAGEDRKLVGAYSRGMRQRLGIAEILIKEPQLIIFDEPTLGLDPEGITAMLQLIKDLSTEESISVLMCSHLLYQAQNICDRVGILNQGRLVAKGSMDELAGGGLTAADGTLRLEDIYMRYFQEEENAQGVS